MDSTNNINDFIRYFEIVGDDITREVNTKIPKIQKETRKIVRRNLTKKAGVDKGIYKKSLVIRDLSESPEMIHFQVGGNKKHYRLTHLLEHGHHIVVTDGDGTQRCLLKSTKAIPHIEPGQDYADSEVLSMYDEAIMKGLNRKL